MIRKGGYQFSEKIVPKQKDRARCRFNHRDLRAILATTAKEKLFEAFAGRLLIAWQRLSGYL
jgi:hypothetical protein